jgi:hypothetical protein
VTSLTELALYFHRLSEVVFCSPAGTRPPDIEKFLASFRVPQGSKKVIYLSGLSPLPSPLPSVATLVLLSCTPFLFSKPACGKHGPRNDLAITRQDDGAANGKGPADVDVHEDEVKNRILLSGRMCPLSSLSSSPKPPPSIGDVSSLGVSCTLDVSICACWMLFIFLCHHVFLPHSYSSSVLYLLMRKL